MLQIITGRFFESDDCYENIGRGVIYSNFSWHNEIDLTVGTLRTVDLSGSVKSYVFDYIIKLEKINNSSFNFVRVGDGKIMEQLKYLLTFAFNAYFDTDKENVAKYCRSQSRDYLDYYIPQKMLHRIFNSSIHSKESEIEIGKTIIEKILSLSRKDFMLVMSCIKTYYDALQVVNYNFELSYSMHVYCLEALSQNVDITDVTWDDYPSDKRLKIDRIINRLDNSDSITVRNTIISGEHLSLTKKFVRYINDIISDNFFENDSVDIHKAIKKTELNQLVLSAYNIRSRYVHSLDQILDTLKVEQVAIGETFEYQNSPYLTLKGLNRLTRTAIFNQVMSFKSVENEKINWIDQLPNMISFEVAPNYWIWQSENFNVLQSDSRLSGFLSLLESAIFNDGSLVILTELMDLYENMIPTVKDRYKHPMLALYILYNDSVSKENKSKNYDKITSQFKDVFIKTSIYGSLIEAILFFELTDSIFEIEEEYHKYKKNKNRIGALVIPHNIISIILVTLRNKAIIEKQLEFAEKILNEIILDYSGKQNIQNKLRAKGNDEKFEYTELIELIKLN